MESSMWGAAWTAATEKLGATAFYQLLATGGIFYHLYNQVRGHAGGIANCACARGLLWRSQKRSLFSVLLLWKWGDCAEPVLGCWAFTTSSLPIQRSRGRKGLLHAPSCRSRSRPHVVSVVLSCCDAANSTSSLPHACATCAPCGMQASYMVLNQGVSPVTFSVGNTMKRVAVIASSIVFFKNPVSALNYAGSAIAILGTYLYSVATDKHAAEKKAAAAKPSA
eukprot:365053-Chlamydomonas_euryale.AAC.12